MLAGQTVVVTGGGQGIGRALALKTSALGASVVVNDLDTGACDVVAAEVGGISVPGDCASEAGIARIIGAATSAYGPVDIFFANAGVDAPPGANGLQADDSTWERVLDVNLMAHVRAARLLVPGWLERGYGRLVVTASAAGLLTAVGSPAYTVSKHGAVAFAEWLSVTYGARGVRIQAICPQAVDTTLFAATGAAGTVVGRDSVITPEAVAEAWSASCQREEFLVLPHPEVADYYARRATQTDQWLTGMRRLQAKVDAASAAD